MNTAQALLALVKEMHGLPEHEEEAYDDLVDEANGLLSRHDDSALDMRLLADESRPGQVCIGFSVHDGVARESAGADVTLTPSGSPQGFDFDISSGHTLLPVPDIIENHREYLEEVFDEVFSEEVPTKAPPALAGRGGGMSPG